MIQSSFWQKGYHGSTTVVIDQRDPFAFVPKPPSTDPVALTVDENRRLPIKAIYALDHILEVHQVGKPELR